MKHKKGSLITGLLGMFADAVEQSVANAIQQAVEATKSSARKTTQDDDKQKKNPATQSDAKQGQTTQSGEKQSQTTQAGEKQNQTTQANAKQTGVHQSRSNIVRKLVERVHDLQITLLPSDTGGFRIVQKPRTNPQSGERELWTICRSYSGTDAEVRIPEGVCEIADGAFAGNITMRSVKAPNSLRNIGKRAFIHCSVLQSVDLPNSVSRIGDEAFADCPALEKLVFPNSVEKLGTAVVRDCSALKHVTLPRHLKAIPERAFENCISLNVIDWPVQMPELNYRMFVGAFTPDLWEYFDIVDGKCIRVRGDMNVMPSQAAHLMFEGSYYERYAIVRLLTWASNITPLQNDLIALHLTIISESMELAAILSCADSYAALELINDLFDFFIHNIERTIDDYQRLIHAAFILALMSITDNGSTYAEMDKQICQSMRDFFRIGDNMNLDSCPDDLKKRILADLPKDLTPETADGDDDRRRIDRAIQRGLFADIGVKITTQRYNPEIIHHVAILYISDKYWTFVHRIEGLLRGIGLSPDQYEVECDPNEPRDTWMRAWSRAMWEDELVIIVFWTYDTDEPLIPWNVSDFNDRIFLSIANAQQAQDVLALFERYHCRDLVEVWQNGERLPFLKFV